MGRERRIKSHKLRAKVEAFLSVQQAYEKIRVLSNMYTVATKEVNEIKISEYYCVCASCEELFWPCVTEVDERKLSQKKEEFFDWTLQIALACMGAKPKRFSFLKIPELGEWVNCLKCGYKVPLGLNCVVESGKDKEETVIIHDFNDSDGFVPAEYEEDYINLRKGSLRTKVVFDHKKGQTYFTLSDNYGGKIKHLDLSEEDEPLKGYKMREYINSDIQIKKVLLEAFSQFYKKVTFPFLAEELDLDKMILLNKYRGYPRNFYDGIPFSCNSRKIDESFGEISKELSSRRYSEVDKLYLQLGLPDKKAIRRIIFDNPSLLFYGREIRELPFDNADILQQLLTNDVVFRLLSKLHSFPGAMGFISDMIEEKGEVHAWNCIAKNCNNFEFRAALYAIATPESKRLMVKSKGVFTKLIESGVELPYSLPVVKNELCTVPDISNMDGHDFILLKNTFDYQKAGRELNNCLGDFVEEEGRIFVAKRKGKYVASIRVYEDVIEQALLSGNESIVNDKLFLIAFEKWVKKHNLLINIEDDY